MLTNKIVFARLMALLRSIDPSVPLPEALEPKLWKDMDEEPLCKIGRVLEDWNAIPGKAYYVVRGFVIVFAFDEEEQRYTFRIYGRNTIVAMDCFMKQYKSPFMIWGCRGASVWSITSEHMDEIYKEMDGMKDMAWKTASEFQVSKERSRNNLFTLSDELRVLKFYAEFKELLPARKSPVQDQEIADYLDLSLVKFRRTRKKLIEEGRLDGGK